jgi:prevent-host-death family protein
MDERVGLREMRQRASELVRRVEAGEEIVVTVAGRPAARLVPFGPTRWRKGHEIRHLFETPTDPAWPAEHVQRPGELDDLVRDPWAGRTEHA